MGNGEWDMGNGIWGSPEENEERGESVPDVSTTLRAQDKSENACGGRRRRRRER